MEKSRILLYNSFKIASDKTKLSLSCSTVRLDAQPSARPTASIFLGRWGWIWCLHHAQHHFHVVICAIPTLRMCNNDPLSSQNTCASNWWFCFISISVFSFHCQLPFLVSVCSFHFISIFCLTICLFLNWPAAM